MSNSTLHSRHCRDHTEPMLRLQDDGSGIIACEKCNVWQHLACLHITNNAAEDKDFHFVCSLCKRREEDKEKSAKNPIKLDFRKLGSSISPPSDKTVKMDVGSIPISVKKRKSSEVDQVAPAFKKIKQTAVEADMPTINGTRHSVSDANLASENQTVAHTDSGVLESQNFYPAVSEARPGRTAPLANGDLSSSRPSGVMDTTLQTAHRLVNGMVDSNGYDAAGAKNSALPLPSNSQPLAPEVPNGIFHHPLSKPQDENGLHQGSPMKARPSTSSHVAMNSDDVFSGGHPTLPRSGNVNGSPHLNGVFIAPPPALESGSSPPMKHSSPPVSSSSIYGSIPSIAEGSPALPPSSSGVSPVKRLPPPRRISSPGAYTGPDAPTSNGVAASVFENGTVNILPPAPSLSPNPGRVDLTPPHKKLAAAPSPPLGVTLNALNAAMATTITPSLGSPVKSDHHVQHAE